MKRIVVTGDICMNTLMWSTAPITSDGQNWQSHNNVKVLNKHGEAMLLAEMIAIATKLPVDSPAIPLEKSIKESKLLRSYAELDFFGDYKAERILRVKRFFGFSEAEGKAALLPIDNDPAEADLIAIDDENNGFNNESSFWPLAIKNTASAPIILYKMNKPIATSELWKHIKKHHIDRTIVIINADDLRSKNVNLSKSLSWEKTALDFVWQLNNNPNLSFLADCRHLIIPFGLEGVIHYKNTGTAESYLYFLPYEFEGDFMREREGKMFGLTSCFVAGLAGAIVEYESGIELSDIIPGGIRYGMAAARKYFSEGFGRDPMRNAFPSPGIFERKTDDSIMLEHVQDVKIHNIKSQNCRNCWYILKEKSSANLAEIAFNIVKFGDENALRSIPTAKFGRLKTVDRTEIESYRSIRNLIAEYISSRVTTRPLSIAVFGTPGSGKSYGVSEVASSIAPEKIEKLSYNLSQFSSTAELIKVFHKIRDYALKDVIPLIVFDEFDCAYEGKLGWLKYFLAPMQDGIFWDMGTTHPIGKAIFVFAGGTSSSYSEFCGENIQESQELKQFAEGFKSSKGPDFISRLRGYVNILGPNQSDGNDHLYIIRRAMLLRALIERKQPHLINETGEAQIDNGVLRAMLKIPRYKHESRSMEAIMEMSTLNNAKKWEQSLFPPREQLKLHVDEEQFLHLMMHDAIFSEKIEFMAEMLRDKHLSKINTMLSDGDDGKKAWKILDDSQKEIYREQIKHIPEALYSIQYDVIYTDNNPDEKKLSEHEVGELTEFEWKRQRNRNTNASKIISKECTHQMVSLWIEVLSDSGFTIERLTFVNLCECI